jgi:hypothetical protein
MTYAQRRAAYIAYLDMKVREQDWHGVADCAMDLRELDAYERTATTRARFGARSDARDDPAAGADLRISSICEAGGETAAPESDR